MRKFTRPVVAGACLLGGLFGAAGVVVAIDLWNTNESRYVLFNAAGGIGTPTYLGFSSGTVSPALPQRWLAQPFTLAQDANVTAIESFGFIPVGSEYDNIVVKIWRRPADSGGNPVPPTIAGGDLLHDISVTPAPPLRDFFENDMDPEADDPNMPNYRLVVPININLVAGRYYATVHGGTPTPPNTTSNWAWFANAPACPEGTAFIDTAGLPGTVVPPPWPYMWRSATHPAPGYGLYQLYNDPSLPGAPTYYQDPAFPHDGDPSTCEDNPDNEDLYVAGLRLEGTFTTPGCPGDLDGDGDTDLSDLAGLLAQFGQTNCPSCTGDVEGNDDDVDLSDLSLLLANFGCS